VLQVKQILEGEPFALSAGAAQLVARYAIEDSQEEYVYYHESNENKREIVKSIIKAAVNYCEPPTNTELA
jgi:hypothetical protein